MNENEANKQNREEELKDIDLSNISGGESSASVFVNDERKQGKLSVQSDSIDAAVDIYELFADETRW